MKKITIFCLSILMTFGITNNVQAQLDSALTISGSVDMYYRANFNSTNDVSNGTFSPATSFANLPGFSLGMANLILDYQGEKTGFVADFVFGPRGADAVFASEAPLNIVNQLYAYLSLSDKVTATIGNFNTFLGYEVISPTGNYNYSTSYMFSYGPFSHTGLKFDFDLGSGFSLLTAVLNPTDFTDYNPTAEYLGGIQLGYSGDQGGAWLNFLFDDDFFQADLTAGCDISEKIYVGLNVTTASDNFFGAAGYLQLATSEELSIGLRTEYFRDNGIGILVGDEGELGSVVDFTLSANYTIGNLTLIPEVRLDAFSTEGIIVTDLENLENGKNISSFVLAAVYGF